MLCVGVSSVPPFYLQGGRDKMNFDDLKIGAISEGNGNWWHFVVRTLRMRPHGVYSLFIILKLSLYEVGFFVCLIDFVCLR